MEFLGVLICEDSAQSRRFMICSPCGVCVTKDGVVAVGDLGLRDRRRGYYRSVCLCMFPFFLGENGF